MKKLYDKDTGQFIGAITEEQFAFLQDHLEEESLDDRDYYLNQAMVEALEQADADAALLRLLRRALGEKEEVEVWWETE
ncbi:MAG TPA: galactosyldiacylglycerol synthase [Methylomirabilota bacterium]|nr:galactosyldiacylglycerol synthase [Methylomirabilota bacterium]